MSTNFDEFKEIVWSELEDAVNDVSGIILDANACRDHYEQKCSGEWYAALRRNYQNSLSNGLNVCDPDDIAHFESNYYLCARIAGKRAAKKAPDGKISLREFDEALDYVHSLMARASNSITITQYLCT